MPVQHCPNSGEFPQGCTSLMRKQIMKGKRAMEQEEKIVLLTDTGEKVDLYVLEETRVNGMDYLLATDSEDEDADGECYILKDISKAEDQEAVYEFVQNDDELEYLFGIFSELISDMDVKLCK